MKRFLLDTHTLIWWAEDDSRLSSSARKIIGSSSNEIFISVVNVWEIGIKAKLGKLLLKESPREYISKVRADNDFPMLAIEAEHAVLVYELPLHHNDPFDRLLIAQAKSEKMILLSDDKNFSKYEVALRW